MKKLIFLAFASLFLVACGGSGGNPTTLTGVFLDSAVIGIDYQTQTQSGTTNLQGEYRYLSGESVTFTIGKLVFPFVQASAIITPFDIAATTNIKDVSVINMISLLQSLDKDNNPENGINITDADKSLAVSIAFSESTSTFQNALMNIVNNSGQDSPGWRTVDSAIAHFSTTVGRILPMNMLEKTASSTYTRDNCSPGSDTGGWMYSFEATRMIAMGHECSKPSETATIERQNAPVEFPFISCVSYPTCKSSDFNKAITGTDIDGRLFTATYSYDNINGVLTYTKIIPNGEFFPNPITEEITIKDK